MRLTLLLGCAMQVNSGAAAAVCALGCGVAVDPATHHVFLPLQVGPDGTPVLRIMQPV